ncbi:two-component system LytT family response regulator [Pedobacter sp. UYP30]|uniref:LytR/AlgR family response regulator transcription factor n=1 Tax=Pedobacter sp. UYP30 TaxID=1756400 RepID=UPI003394DF61
MRAILVDDERENLDNLQILLEKYCPQVKVIGCAQQLDQAEKLIKLHQPDLLFLDIQMGRNTGFDLLNKLDEKLFEVIFVTAYDQYGIQAIKFAALDYLLKPVNIAELTAAVAKADIRIKDKMQYHQLSFLLNELKNAKTNLPKIALPQQNEITYVLVKDIIRCEADNTYTFFYLANGDRVLVSKPLKEYADLLKVHGFLRVHRSHLVNPSLVKSWLKEDGGTLLMNNGDKFQYPLPIEKW